MALFCILSSSGYFISALANRMLLQFYFCVLIIKLDVASRMLYYRPNARRYAKHFQMHAYTCGLVIHRYGKHRPALPCPAPPSHVFQVVCTMQYVWEMVALL